MADELLALARRAELDRAARWELASSEKVASIVGREVARHAKNAAEAEDLRSEATLRIVELFETRRLEFGSQGQLVSYLDRSIKGIVEAALRATVASQFHYGRVVRRELNFFEEGAVDLTGPMRREAEGAHADAEAEAEVAHAADSLSKIMASAPDRVGRGLVAAAAGASWREVAESCGFSSSEDASVACCAFLARAVDALVEDGEAVTPTIMAVHVDSPEVGVVLWRRGEVVESWQVECWGVESVKWLDRRLRRALNRRVSQVVTNEAPPCDASWIASIVCRDRGVPIESWDYGALVGRASATLLEALGEGLTPAERRAALLAAAKEAENVLKERRYPA